jgi:hypothetical protein
MRNARLGRKFSPLSEETKAKMRETALRNGNHPVHSKPHSEEAKKRISLSKLGKKPWNYKEDRSLLKPDDELRRGQHNKDWSRNVKNRDGWKCRISNGDCSGRLEAHHILGWVDHPELRYQINNGITLCRFHHPRKRDDVRKLTADFQKLVGEAHHSECNL